MWRKTGIETETETETERFLLVIVVTEEHLNDQMCLRLTMHI